MARTNNRIAGMDFGPIAAAVPVVGAALISVPVLLIAGTAASIWGAIKLADYMETPTKKRTGKRSYHAKRVGAPKRKSA